MSFLQGTKAILDDSIPGTISDSYSSQWQSNRGPLGASSSPHPLKHNSEDIAQLQNNVANLFQSPRWSLNSTCETYVN